GPRRAGGDGRPRGAAPAYVARRRDGTARADAWFHPQPRTAPERFASRSLTVAVLKLGADQAYFALPAGRAVPAWVQVRSTPVATQATSTLDLPKVAATVSPHWVGGGRATLFWPLMALREPVSRVKAAMPSLAKAAAAVLGTKGASTARTEARSTE